MNEVTVFKECGHTVIWGQISVNAEPRCKKGDVMPCHHCGRARTVKSNERKKS